MVAMPFFLVPNASGAISHRRSFRVLECQPEFLGQRLAGRLRVLPRPLRLEARIPDATAPRSDDAADGAEVGAVRMLLVQPANDVGGDTDEGAQRRCALDAVLAAVPGGPEYLRDLLEIVHVELPRLFAELVSLAPRPERLAREQPLQFLRERRLGHAPAADSQQLDIPKQRRIIPIVQRPDDVVGGGE